MENKSKNQTIYSTGDIRRNLQVENIVERFFSQVEIQEESDQIRGGATVWRNSRQSARILVSIVAYGPVCDARSTLVSAFAVVKSQCARPCSYPKFQRNPWTDTSGKKILRSLIARPTGWFNGKTMGFRINEWYGAPLAHVFALKCRRNVDLVKNSSKP